MAEQTPLPAPESHRYDGRPATEKPFPTDLLVVEAKRGVRDHVGGLITMIVITLVCLVAACAGVMWTISTYTQPDTLWNRIVAPVATLIAVLLALAGPLATMGAWYDLLDARRLNQRSVRTTAWIVGRESLEQEDAPDQLFVFYQHGPDFIVRMQDQTPTRQWHRLPIGTQILVEHLPENPQASRPVSEAGPASA